MRLVAILFPEPVVPAGDGAVARQRASDAMLVRQSETGIIRAYIPTQIEMPSPRCKCLRMIEPGAYFLVGSALADSTNPAASMAFAFTAERFLPYPRTPRIDVMTPMIFEATGTHAGQ